MDELTDAWLHSPRVTRTTFCAGCTRAAPTIDRESRMPPEGWVWSKTTKLGVPHVLGLMCLQCFFALPRMSPT